MIGWFWRRWQVVPTWVKVVPAAGLLAGLSFVEHFWAMDSPDFSAAVERLYFLPLFMASLLFGLWGGLVAALLISLNYLPTFLAADLPPLNCCIQSGIEVALYFLTGALTGFLVDRERKEARRLKEAQDMAILGRAAAAVAHELKTPLVAIGGFAQRINRDLEAGHPHHRELGIIVDQVDHMENLLREMLDYSRPLELRLKEHRLGELLDEVTAMASMLAEQSGVTLEVNLEADETVLVDGARLKQVFLNLMQNALQASQDGGRVVVTSAVSGSWLLVSVADRGRGIAPEYHEKVFEAFFTTKRRGTGLGLAICKKIVETHGGRLTLDSDPGAGSTFTVHLRRSAVVA